MDRGNLRQLHVKLKPWKIPRTYQKKIPTFSVVNHAINTHAFYLTTGTCLRTLKHQLK